MFHEMKYRVPYADTDRMGVVYHANYLVYFERSRTEMMRDAGISGTRLEELGFFLPVAEVNCQYKGSAHYDDLLTFRSHIEKLGRVKIVIHTDVLREDQLLASGTVVLGCVDHDFKITPLAPEAMRCFQQCMLTEEGKQR